MSNESAVELLAATVPYIATLNLMCNNLHGYKNPTFTACCYNRLYDEYILCENPNWYCHLTYYYITIILYFPVYTHCHAIFSYFHLYLFLNSFLSIIHPSPTYLICFAHPYVYIFTFSCVKNMSIYCLLRSFESE